VVGLLPDLIVGRLSHFTLGNLNSHSCKIYIVGSNYNCMPNTILSNIYNFSHLDSPPELSMSIIWFIYLFFISCSTSGSQLCPPGRQEIFLVTWYDLNNPTLFDVGHVEHNDVQYQGRALSVDQQIVDESTCKYTLDRS
jgi:hypothetical protein